MITRPVFLIIILWVLNSTVLSAQQSDDKAEENKASAQKDSLWSKDNTFSEILTIPSYEDLLSIYYASVLEVDKHLHFNPYRFQPGNTEKVNPFVYENILLAGDSISSLENYKQNFNKKGTFEKDAQDIMLDSRSYISQTKPELITVTWDQLPDVPKTEKAEIIYGVNLDLTEIDKRSRRINHPEKFEKQNYVHYPWHIKMVSMLNANQTSFSNWSNGGSNSFSLSGHLVIDADYMSYDKKTRWENDAEFRLGYVQQEQHKSLVKNLDLFRLNSQFARNAFNKWFYAINAELTSQFFNGYDLNNDNSSDLISAFMAPAYLKVAVGLDYKYGTEKNDKIFSVQTSPLSYKLTYVRDTSKVDQERYGIDANRNNRQEIGGSVQLSSEYAYNKKMYVSSRLLFFSNYMEKPENIDVNWNTTITYHFNRIFAVTFTLDTIYDDDTDILLSEADDGFKTYGQRLQVKEFLGFGLTYRFM